MADIDYSDEKNLVLDRTYTCPICDAKIKAKSVKANSAKFVDTCNDLRPIHSNVNITKYDTVSCWNCGYTALTKSFNQTTQTQRKNIRDKIQANFKSHPEATYETYSTDLAISRLKMALLCADAKPAKKGEMGNICLKLSWLYQDYIDELDESAPDFAAKKEALLKEADNAGQRAYNLFVDARMEEDFPIAGMTETTLDYLIAYLGYKNGDYAKAMQYLTGVVTSKNTSPRLKDKALELKDLLNEKLHPSD